MHPNPPLFSPTHIPSGCTEAHPDAALLTLGRGFDARVTAWLESIPVAQQADATVRAMLRAYHVPGSISLKSVDEVEARLRVTGIGEQEGITFEAVTEPLDEIIEQPALTIEGLAVKARAVAAFNWPWGTYEQDEATDTEDRFEKRQLRDLIESVCALAGVDWRGRPRSGGALVPRLEEQPEPMQPAGFIPYPVDRPSFLMSIKQAIPLEAERLLTIAQDEVERRAAAYDDRPPAERAEFRIDSLAAVLRGTEAVGTASDPIFAATRPAAAPWRSTSPAATPLMPTRRPATSAARQPAMRTIRLGSRSKPRRRARSPAP